MTIRFGGEDQGDALLSLYCVDWTTCRSHDTNMTNAPEDGVNEKESEPATPPGENWNVAFSPVVSVRVYVVSRTMGTGESDVVSRRE